MPPASRSLRPSASSRRPSRHPGHCSSCRWRRFARRTTEALSSHSPAGMDPPDVTRSRCSAGSTRPTTRSAASASPTGPTIGELTPESLAAPLYVGPVAAGARPRRAVGDALDLGPPAPPRRMSVGPRADPRVAPQAPARGDVRGLRRARRRRNAQPRRGARRPAPAGRAPRAARCGGRRLRSCRRARGDRGQDRAPPSARVRRRGGTDGDGREPPVGADQGRRARRRSRAGRWHGRGDQECAGRDQPVAARTGVEPGDAGARREHRVRLAVDRRRARQGDRGARGARGQPAPTASGPRNSATSCSCSSTSPDATASSPKPRSARPTTSSGGGSASVERQAAEQGVALRDLDFEALDELWHAAKAEERSRA